MNNIIEMVNITRPVAWLPWAVQYFFLIGISVTSLFLALPGLAFDRPRWRRIGGLALWGALACGIAAPVALLADLHQPGRFWRFYLHPNLHSWMAIGAFLIPGYLAGLLLFTWAALRPALARAPGGTLTARLQRLAALGGGAAPRLRALGAVLAVGFGAGVLLYTGMEVMVVRARPLWNTPLLPVQFALTALVGALGLALVLDRLSPPRQPASTALLSRLTAAGLLGALAVGGVWLASGLTGLDPVAATALAALAGLRAWEITAVWTVVASLVTTAIALAAPVRAGWLVGLLALHACWMFRWTVFIGGQSVPKTGAGMYDYQLPLGHDGLLGIAGVAGLCVFLLIALGTLLPLNGETAAGRA